MSNSSLVNYTSISPNSSNPRKDTIKKITIHHMSGNLSVETCGEVFSSSERQASSNYGVSSDGRVGLYVEEKNRAWTSSNGTNDHQAITIEVANDVCSGNWHVSDTALNKLIELCVDICRRNGIARLNYTGDTNGNLTMHKWFANTDCPGPYLESKFPYIADEVNRILNGGASKPVEPSKPSNGDKSYAESGKAVVCCSKLNVRSKPSVDSEIVASYSNGESFVYDYVYIQNGYVWVSYIGGSGLRRYVAVKVLSSGERLANCY